MQTADIASGASCSSARISRSGGRSSPLIEFAPEGSHGGGLCDGRLLLLLGLDLVLHHPGRGDAALDGSVRVLRADELHAESRAMREWILASLLVGMYVHAPTAR